MKLPTRTELFTEFQELHRASGVERVGLEILLNKYVRLAEDEAWREALEKAMSILRARSMLSSMHKTDCDAIRYSLQEIEALKAAPATAEAGKGVRAPIQETTSGGYVPPPALPPSAEQRVRDMLERLGVDGAQSYSAGDLVELANAVSHAPPATPPSKAVTEEPDRLSMSGLIGLQLAQQKRIDRIETRLDALEKNASKEASLGQDVEGLAREAHRKIAGVTARLDRFESRIALAENKLDSARSAAGGKTGETRTVGEVPFEEIKDLLSGHPLRRPPPSSEQIEEAYRRGWNDLLKCAIDWSATEEGEEPNTLKAWVAHAEARHKKAPAAREGSGA